MLAIYIALTAHYTHITLTDRNRILISFQTVRQHIILPTTTKNEQKKLYLPMYVIACDVIAHYG